MLLGSPSHASFCSSGQKTWAITPEFAVGELPSPGSRGTRASAEVERVLQPRRLEGWPPPPGPSGTATSAEGCTTPRGGGSSGASVGSFGSALKTRQELPRPRGPALGPGMSAWKPGQCPLGARKINDTLGVGEGRSSKAGLSPPHWCLGCWVRVLGGTGSPKNGPGLTAFSVLIGIYSWLGEVVRILSDFLMLIL